MSAEFVGDWAEHNLALARTSQKGGHIINFMVSESQLFF